MRVTSFLDFVRPSPSLRLLQSRSCLPRADLMITVGTVYMSIPGAPVKEIMKDMMEMTRGVQHPTRGLFLRHYLSGMTRDHLPVGEDDGYVFSRLSLLAAVVVLSRLHTETERTSRRMRCDACSEPLLLLSQTRRQPP